ncbi:unnamed protein product [Protopolystoma xenopodis]|uniref:EF-hand domain-containing protein n=1 Tax=Protopolystoma xenopodis TaxID=117903 RepID=A0A3S5AY36_9PLAT|nr:unnamed protein product [Protopolystoma xenopodis]
MVSPKAKANQAYENLSAKSKAQLTRLEKLSKKDDTIMEQSIAEYMKNWETFEKFVDRVDNWYAKNEKKYIKYMSLYNREMISKAEFKVALGDLSPSLNDVEIHALYRMMDTENIGQVEYSRLYEAIWRALGNKYVMEDDINRLDLDMPDKWIQMTFKVPSFEPFDMPTTFEHLINLDYTGSMLRQLIRSKVTGLATRNIVIFTEAARYAETVVKCHQRLSDFNYTGGAKCAPNEAVIFYDFSMGKIDCPLLTHVRNQELNEKTKKKGTKRS